MSKKFLSAPGQKPSSPRTASGASQPARFAAGESRQGLVLPWIDPRAAVVREHILPVFLPFWGCPVRCVFCAQDVQTGQAGQDRRPGLAAARGAGALAGVLGAARSALESRAERGLPPAELAFYGGTFTALPEADLAACLHLAATALQRGWITSFRCSTRPDRVSAPLLDRLRDAGCRTVELGVQSFADQALAASRRVYDGAAALAACALVRGARLRLGVQLLPGMPGHSPDQLAGDVALALGAGADMLRFYPCLVLEGTELARMWRAGHYRPWPLAMTLDVLAEAWLTARQAGVPVVRMGLAPEAGLERAVLAGPADPALGGRVMSRGLLLAVRQALAGPGEQEMFDLQVPRAAQGYFWGSGGELRPAWAALGLGRVLFADEPALRVLPPAGG